MAKRLGHMFLMAKVGGSIPAEAHQSPICRNGYLASAGARGGIAAWRD